MSEMNEDLHLPKNSAYMQAKMNDTKARFSGVLDEFKKILADKTHPDNQTSGYHNNVKSILTRLLTTSDELDKVSPGEGIFGLLILSLRSSLKMKDEIIRAEVRIRNLEKMLERETKQQR